MIDRAFDFKMLPYRTLLIEVQVFLIRCVLSFGSIMIIRQEDPAGIHAYVSPLGTAKPHTSTVKSYMAPCHGC
jgi:hypothetical protein